MLICGREIESNEEYVQLNLIYKRGVKRFSIIFCLALIVSYLVLLIPIIFSLDVWSVYGYMLGRVISFFIYFQVVLFIRKPWNKDMLPRHKLPDQSNGEQSESYEIKPVSFMRAVIATIIDIWIILSSISALPQAIYYCLTLTLSDYIYWVGLMTVITAMIYIFCAIVFLSILIKWFSYFRWSWEELQLTPAERKAKYSEERNAYKQVKNQKRQASCKQISDRIKKKFSRTKMIQPKIPTSKNMPVQYIDRRSELENLKSLYEEGLIDEEEYKKAKDKILNL